MRRCTACKSPVRPDDRFCARCGSPQPDDDAPRGNPPRWTIEQSHVRWSLAHPAGRVLLVAAEAGARDRLCGYSQTSGELLWAYPAEDSGTEPLLADRSGFLVLSGARVLRYDAESGELAWATALEGRGSPVVRPRPESPISVLVLRQGDGLHETRALTLDVLTGRAREVTDQIALEAIAGRRLVGRIEAGQRPELLPRVGGDLWARNGSALFVVAVVREAPATTGAARSAGLVVAVDVHTREPSVTTTRAAGIPLAAGQVHFAETDEGDVLVWATSDGLTVLPLDDKLDPIRFEVPGLTRLAAVSGRLATVEVRSPSTGVPSVLVVTLPFGKPVWQNPGDQPCTALGLDDTGRALLARSRVSRSILEFRPRDHGFRRTFDLPDAMDEGLRGRERVEPGPATLVSAGRMLVVSQVRERVTVFAAFAREPDDKLLVPQHRNVTTSL
jgi:hypothetical protein